MRTIRSLLLLLALAPATHAASPAAAQDIRVGYWSSGASAALGIVLSEGRFLEAEGLRPTWVTVTKLAEVNRALVSRSIDVAVAGGTVPSLRLGVEHVPAHIVLATLVAEANIVVPEASPLRTLEDLRGKRIGSTPPGSTMYALAAAILHNDATQIPSGEAQLLTFLQRGEIDAALMRTITLRTLGDAAKLRVIATVPTEWKRLIGADSPPILGVAVVDDAFAARYPDAVTRFVVAEIKATRWGAAHPDEVATMLARALQMTPADALAFARSWSVTYIASFEDADIASLLKMADIFKGPDFPDDVPRGIFWQEPYLKAKALLDQAR